MRWTTMHFRWKSLKSPMRCRAPFAVRPPDQTNQPLPRSTCAAERAPSFHEILTEDDRANDDDDRATGGDDKDSSGGG